MRPCWVSLSQLSLLLVAVSSVWVVSCQSSPSPDAGRAGNPADEAASRDGPAPEVVDLAPDSRPGFGMRNVFAPITGLFMGGPSYWYGPREVEIDTTPPGGLIDLFYVRRNFQKRFEQAEAPVIVLLPKRIEAGPRDSVKVRAYREGYRQEEVSFRVSSRRVKVLIDLEPGDYELEVSYTGCETQTLPVRVWAGELTVRDVSLVRR